MGVSLLLKVQLGINEELWFIVVNAAMSLIIFNLSKLLELLQCSFISVPVSTKYLIPFLPRDISRCGNLFI